MSISQALEAAQDADRALRRLRDSGRATAWQLQYAEARCDRAWATVGELDRPVAARKAA